jgi:hypothetical protein
VLDPVVETYTDLVVVGTVYVDVHVEGEGVVEVIPTTSGTKIQKRNQGLIFVLFLELCCPFSQKNKH